MRNGRAGYDAAGCACAAPAAQHSARLHIRKYLFLNNYLTSPNPCKNTITVALLRCLFFSAIRVIAISS
jgi:hypothetical protein